MKELLITAKVPGVNGAEDIVGTITTQFPDAETEGAIDELLSLCSESTVIELVEDAFKVKVQNILRARLRSGSDYSDINGVKPGQTFRPVAADPVKSMANALLQLSSEDRAAKLAELKALLNQ